MKNDVPVIDATTIRNEWNQGSPESKQLLEKLYGKNFFVFGDIRDRVKSIEQACTERGKDFAKEFPPALLKLLTPDEIAYREWKAIQEALNEGVEMDYSNPKQEKWEIWMKWVSGRGLSLCDVSCGLSYASVGPRLAFARKELAEYAVEQFPDVFNRFFNKSKK